MSPLYSRILLWHKLVAMQTGSLALCSAKHRLNRDEAAGWIDALRRVADDMTQFLHDGTFALDDKGQRVVQYGVKGPAPGNAHEEVATGTQSGSPNRAAGRKAGGLRVATRKVK